MGTRKAASLLALQSRRLLYPGSRTVMKSVNRYCSVLDQKTTATVMNQEEDTGLMIDSYSQIGFRLNNGMAVVGPIAIFPKSVLSWKVDSYLDINEDSLSLFYMLEPKLDLLILGVGDSGNRIDPKLVQFMRRKGISVEILPTQSACTTFNFLCQERRYVAAALIPPLQLKYTDDELLREQLRQRKLFQIEKDYI